VTFGTLAPPLLLFEVATRPDDFPKSGLLAKGGWEAAK